MPSSGRKRKCEILRSHRMMLGVLWQSAGSRAHQQFIIIIEAQLPTAVGWSEPLRQRTALEPGARTSHGSCTCIYQRGCEVPCDPLDIRRAFRVAALKCVFIVLIAVVVIQYYFCIYLLQSHGYRQAISAKCILYPVTVSSTAVDCGARATNKHAYRPEEISKGSFFDNCSSSAVIRSFSLTTLPPLRSRFTHPTTFRLCRRNLKRLSIDQRENILLLD